MRRPGFGHGQWRGVWRRSERHAAGQDDGAQGQRGSAQSERGKQRGSWEHGHVPYRYRAEEGLVAEEGMAATPQCGVRGWCPQALLSCLQVLSSPLHLLVDMCIPVFPGWLIGALFLCRNPMCRVHSRPVLICIVKSENKRLDGCFQLYVTIQEPQSAGSSVIDAGQFELPAWVQGRP